MSHSGTGNSYQSDMQKCARYFFHEHRLGLTWHGEGSGDEAVALTAGIAGHAWKEKFYGSVLLGASLDDCIKAGDEAFWSAGELSIVKFGDTLSWHTIREHERLMLTQMILKARARVEYERQVSGEEQTLALEYYLEMMLPAEFTVESRPGKVFEIQHTCHQRAREEGGALCIGDGPCLRRYTARLDRVFRSEEKGIVVEDYKFTAAMSPKSFANDMLMNDQSTRYVKLWDLSVSEDLHASNVRYSVHRLYKSITASSYHEEYSPVDEGDIADSMLRLCIERARQSELWDEPREFWQANRYAHGPCIVFGRECKYTQLCTDPGREDEHIGPQGSNKTYWLPAPAESDAGTDSAKE